MNMIREFLKYREVRFSAVIALILWIIERLAAVQGALGLFGMEQQVPKAIVEAASLLISSPFFLVIMGALIVTPILLVSVDRKYRRQLLRIELLFGNLVDVIKTCADSDDKRRGDLLLPFLLKLQESLPGTKEYYRITLAKPRLDGKFDFLASLGVDQVRLAQLHHRADWQQRIGLFALGIDTYSKTKPDNGRLAQIVANGDAPIYINEAPDARYKRGDVHLIITIDPGRELRRDEEPIDPQNLAVITVSCREQESLKKGQEVSLMTSLRHVINGIDAALFQYVLVARLKSGE